ADQLAALLDRLALAERDHDRLAGLRRRLQTGRHGHLRLGVQRAGDGDLRRRRRRGRGRVPRGVGGGRAAQIDDGDQRVVTLDPRLLVALGLVALVGRDREQHPAADLLADQTLVPAGDDAADPDRERRRRTAVVRVVEDLAVAPDLTEVVRGEQLALL